MKKLNTMKTMSNKVQKGFTLIELMIVIAIIGILASVAMPQYQAYMTESEVRGAITESRSYENGVGVCGTRNRGVFTGCNAGTGLIPAIENSVTGVTNGVITVNMGDLDSDGTAEVVEKRPVFNNARIVWGIVSVGGTGVCNDVTGGGDWLECNHTVFVAAGGSIL